MDMIIPAAGSATRMNGIPKFLLPVTVDGKSLIEIHIARAQAQYRKILIPTRSVYIPLLSEIAKIPGVEIFPVDTKTMSETVIQTVSRSDAETFALVMPDTYFHGENPIAELHDIDTDFRIAAWKIRSSQLGKLGQLRIEHGQVQEMVDKDPNCDFEYSWGAISFKRHFLKYLTEEMPHIGYAMEAALKSKSTHDCFIVDGEYFDCGTPAEYFQLISNFNSR